jgi:RNA polymerase sigma-70 factor (ECF subfamily)
MAAGGIGASFSVADSCDDEQPAQSGARTLDEFLAGIERRAFRIAQYACGDAEEALDIVQEAMLDLVRVYRNRPSADWAPLFHRILQNRIRDWRRRTWVRRRWRVWLGDGRADEEEDPLQNIADGTARGPGEQAALNRTAVALQQALGRLPLRQQQAFLLRVWEGLDVAQTADAMGCSEGSVKTHFSRAVHSLRGLLEDHWE